MAEVMKRGKSVLKYPLRCVYLMESTEEVHKESVGVAFSVPKKRLKSAVQRNKVKRRMREAFRLNSGHLRESMNSDKHLSVLFIYVAEQVLDYKTIEKSIRKIISQWG